MQWLESSRSSEVKPLTPELRQGVDATLLEARKQIGCVRLSRLEPSAYLEVDGAEPVRDASGALLLYPGTHVLVISQAGAGERRQELSVMPGSELSLDLRLLGASLSPASAAALKPEAASASHAPDTGGVPKTPLGLRAAPRQARRGGPSANRVMRRLGYGVLGVAGAALISCAVATGLGIQRVDRIERRCREREGCTADEVHTSAREQKLSLLSGLSIGGAVLGGVGLATGVTLWISAALREGNAHDATPTGAALALSGKF